MLKHWQLDGNGVPRVLNGKLTIEERNALWEEHKRLKARAKELAQEMGGSWMRFMPGQWSMPLKPPTRTG